MHEYNISDDTVVNANETMVGVYADAQYDILPSLSGFFDSYCTDSTWITYYDWYYYYNTGDSETTISQRQTEFYYFEFQSYPDGSSDQSGRVAGYIESVYSQLQFNQVLRVQKISPVINTTINGLDGFQIEGDFRSWLDLDNPNILGKSYNEIKAWAEENGFRFATEEDMADLRIAILPIGDVQNDTIDESQYTIEEQGFIGLTAATNFYNTTVG